MSIIIGGDLVPTDSNKELFIKGEKEALIGKELVKILEKAEYRIFNLEVPLTNENSPIEKCGPNLIAPIDTINGIKSLGADILTLANNHILDHGIKGLNSTCKVLDENNIKYLGVGKTLEEASKPYIFEYENKKIGIYACAEHEFSIVKENMPGANPFDSLESPDHVADLKRQCDFVIVLYHGGKEHYRYPSPNLQKVCRKLVQKGADLVICQHSHCIGCEEKYEGGTIVYGQGNFLFDHNKSEFWKTSLLIEIDSNGNINYIPLTKEENVVRLAKDAYGKEIVNKFLERSEEIKQIDFLQNTYEIFARENIDKYYSAVAGKGKRNLVFRVLNKLTNYKWQHFCWQHIYKKTQKLRLINFIECEAHRELFLTGLKK